MKNKILSFFVVLVICLSMAVPVSAATDQYIFDPDDHFTYDEYYELEDMAADIELDYGITVMFCITATMDNYDTIAEFSEDLYYMFTDSTDGIIITHNTTEGGWSSYRCGDGLVIFNDTIEQGLWDAYNEDDTYYGGIVAYLNAAESAILNADLSNAGSNEPETSNNAPATEPTTEFVPVERTLPLLVDNADVLTDDEEADLLAQLEAFVAEHEMEIAIITVTDLEGKTSKAYADDFYDYNGYGYGDNDDGALLLYKSGEVGNRDIAISTYGKAISLYNDAVIDEMLDSAIAYIEYDNYVDGFNSFINLCDSYATKSVPLVWIPVCIILGFVIAWLIIKNKATKENKTDVAQNDASYYARNGSLMITQSYDNFIRKKSEAKRS